MADDTRLAEACLLLNYSSQSYKEQLLLTKKLQQTVMTNDQQVIMDQTNQFTEKTVPTKLITPPPENELMNIVERHENVESDGFLCISQENLMNDYDRSEINNVEEELTEQSEDIYSREQYYEASREPINDLLAAVNCALPSLKGRPNILQRPIYQTSKSSTTPKQTLPDHDYCHQGLKGINDAQLYSCLEQDGLFLSAGDYCKESERKPLQPLSTELTKKPLKLVAVHLGAGNSQDDEESLFLAKTICEELMLQTSYPSLNTPKSKRRKFSSIPIENNNDARRNEFNLSKRNQLTAEDAVVQLIRRMEDEQSLNCGYGSNLNIKGQVECDASLMCDRTQMWAGVGAVSGCRNPILLAKSLYDNRTISRPLGLIQPNLLVGSGAKIWMRENCPHLSVMDSKLISSKAFATYQKLKSKYDAIIRSPNQTLQNPSSLDARQHEIFKNFKMNRLKIESHKRNIAQESSSLRNCSPTCLDHGFYCIKTGNNFRKVESFANANIEEIEYKKQDYIGGDPNQLEHFSPEDIRFPQAFQNDRFDTVGAIAVDCDDNFASAISSGGLLLKFKGRIGQAAVPGAGCWSEDSVSVTTTGVGEYLTLSMFARKFYEKMITLRLLYDLGHVDKKPDLSGLISCGMEECFDDLMKSPALKHVDPQNILAGMLTVCTLNSKDSPSRVDERDLYLSYAHNTKSMCIGYMTCNDVVGHSVMSRKAATSGKDNKTLVKTLKFSIDTNN